MDSPVAIAPPVVAVVVVHEPGPWFDEVVEALAAQDYPSLRVLALVTGSLDGTAERVRAALPEAYVRTIEANVGFGPAANEVLRLVEGGGFFCFLHDDVALAPNAVSALVAELYRSNAGIVGPKLVEWDHPSRLLTVGLPIDKFGEFSSPVEPGELDQEQHDAIRDVFSLPSACLLVRADLFRALGGFDPEIPFFGEALDLCWRAHVSGARVLVVPDAVARHRQAIETRNPDLDPERLAERHRLRTVLSGYGRIHLVRVIPQYALMSVLDAIVRVCTGRPHEAGAVLGAWPWNMARAGSLVVKRRLLRGLRSVPDRELRGLQVRGSARVAAFVRAQGARRDDRLGVMTSAGRSLVHRLRTGERRASIGVWVLAIVVFLVGSRTLVTGRIPVIGELLPYPGSATGMIHTYLAGWWSHGLGGVVPVPTGIGLIGAAGTILFGHLALLHTLVVIGPLLLGWIGTWRLLAPFVVQRARIMGLAVVAGTPLAVNALASGHWSGLVAFGATPFALGRLARVSGLEPFDGRPRPFAVHVAALGLLLAVVAAFVPGFPLVIVAVAAALAIGSLAAGGAGQSVARDWSRRRPRRWSRTCSTCRGQRHSCIPVLDGRRSDRCHSRQVRDVRSHRSPCSTPGRTPFPSSLWPAISPPSPRWRSVGRGGSRGRRGRGRSWSACSQWRGPASAAGFPSRSRPSKSCWHPSRWRSDWRRRAAGRRPSSMYARPG